MKRSETIQLFAVIKALYPRDEAFKNATKDMVDAWTEMLADIPFDHAKAAIKASVSTSPFPPSIAEIRDYATRLTGPRRMTAEEAWGQACEVIRQYGTRTVLKEGAEENPPEYTDVTVECRVYRAVKPQPNLRQYEAELHCDPEVWKLLKNMGYRSVVESDAPDVVRGQFMRAWTLHDQEAKEERVIVPDFLKLLGGRLMIGGAE
ncbi:MAG: hypothetical protein II008_15225 [Oscillospiraceae bacterium]|nr:hypothetical protein [Oscillospiraceae bacterium]